MSYDNMEDSVLIVGAGVFGTSTAYHLAQRMKPSNITIIDRHPIPTPGAASNDPPYGASHDINKIVRSDYTVPFYMELAKEAMAAWNDWDLIKPYFHRSGWILFDEKRSSRGQKIRQNFRERFDADPTDDITFDEAKARWNGILKDADLSEMGSAYVNPDVGWAEADKAVAAMLHGAIEKGVNYHQGRVQGLVLGETGIVGVKLQDGTTLTAGKTVLATGAWTPELMAPIEDQLHIGQRDRLAAQAKGTGICCVHFKLSEDDKTRFANGPVVIFGETLDLLPLEPHGILKFYTSGTFLNPSTKSGQEKISVPWEEDQRIVPEKLKQEALQAVGRFFPKLANGQEVSHWRLCWDLVTPEQHQLITAHPHGRLRNLYMAVGGSFHGWKFLPTIGKYVANVVLGQSNGEEKDACWAWKAEGWDKAGRGANGTAVPTRTLQEVVDAH